MQQNEHYPHWFLWCYDKGLFLFIGAGLVLTSFVVALFVFLDQRLDQLEEESPIPPRPATKCRSLAISPLVTLTSIPFQSSNGCMFPYIPMYTLKVAPLICWR